MRRFAVMALLLLLIPVPFSATAGIIEPGFATYLESIGSSDHASAIVYLSDRPDIGALDRSLRAEKAPLSVRHSQVVTALRDAADRSQPVLLRYLESRKAAGTVDGFTPYWIMNLIIVSATKADLQEIARRPDVEAIGSNFRATLIESNGAAYMGNPLLGIGVTNSLKSINAPLVWRQLGITGAGTLVANLDTGVDGTHPALTARWRGNTHPWQECWRDALGTGTQYPTDTGGHGTHTMGTMCGAGHATGDTVGVAFDALWIADNAINQGVGSAFDNDVVDAFQWFADPDGNPNTTDDVPDIVQNSWGIDARFGGTYQDCDYRWEAVIQNCEAAGVVVTFSAGNEGPAAQTLRSPANIANTPTENFSVGAVDAESYSFPYPIASFSSRGPSDCDGVSIKPEVSAPGVNVYSSYPGGGYAYMSGTSMAGPHVAGVVALMRQANPNADVQTIKSILMSTARDEGTVGEDNNYGWGVIDAYQAVLAVMAPDTVPPTVTVTAPNGGELLTVGSAFTITWTASDNVGIAQTDLHYSSDGGVTYSLIASLNGNPGSYVWTIPNTPSTQCLVRVTAFDGAENQGSDVSNGFFTIQTPQGPYVWVQSLVLSLVRKGSSVNARATVTVLDQNGRPVNGAQVRSHWSGLTNDADVFTTKRTGVGTCDSDRLRNPTGCWNYNVDNVLLAGYSFRNDIGQTSGSICTGVGMQDGVATGQDRLSVATVRHGLTGQAIEFSITQAFEARVQVTIYDVTGRLVRSLADGVMPAGTSALLWDGSSDGGRILPGGIYIYQVTSGSERVTDKVVLLKSRH